MRAGGPRAPPFHFGYGVLSRTIFSIHDVLLRCQSSKSQEMTNGLSGLTRCVNQKAPRNLRIVFYTDVTERSLFCSAPTGATVANPPSSSQPNRQEIAARIRQNGVALPKYLRKQVGDFL
ncbi:uncharacterized protein LOC144770595 isoform X1 [Lissotriton helveticus]